MRAVGMHRAEQSSVELETIFRLFFFLFSRFSDLLRNGFNFFLSVSHLKWHLRKPQTTILDSHKSVIRQLLFYFIIILYRDNFLFLSFSKFKCATSDRSVGWLAGSMYAFHFSIIIIIIINWPGNQTKICYVGCVLGAHFLKTRQERKWGQRNKLANVQNPF